MGFVTDGPVQPFLELSIVVKFRLSFCFLLVHRGSFDYARASFDQHSLDEARLYQVFVLLQRLEEPGVDFVKVGRFLF